MEKKIFGHFHTFLSFAVLTCMYFSPSITGFILVSLIAHIIFLYKLDSRSVHVELSSLHGLDYEVSRKIINISLNSPSRMKSPILEARKNKASKHVKNNKKEEHENKFKSVVSKEEMVINTDIALSENDLNVLPVQQNNKMFSEKKVNLYLKNVIEKIELNKFYPSSARRRNMQERISVSFKLTQQGNAIEIRVTGRNKILNYAAKKAITNSLPFDMPPNDMLLPYKVLYSMDFIIKK